MTQPEDPRPLDSTGHRWSLAPITWEDVRRINRVLHNGVAELHLPAGPDGQALTDLHHPAVQQWFLGWTPSVILVGAVLLADQAKQLGLSEAEFASRWSGDASTSLRAAIWREWLQYLPTEARQHSEQIAQEIAARRAVNAQAASGLIDLLINQGSILVDQSIQDLQRKLQSLGRTASTTASSTPPSSDSIPVPGATASSTPCGSSGTTSPGRKRPGKPQRPVPPG